MDSLISDELQALQRARAALAQADFSTAFNEVRFARIGLSIKAPDSIDHLRSRVLVGEVLAQCGSVHDAVDQFETCLADARLQGNAELLCDLRCRLSLALEDGLALHESALIHACAAYEGAVQSGFAAGMLSALLRMMLASARQAFDERAERLGLLALSLALKSGDRNETRRALLNLAVACACSSETAGADREVASAYLTRGLAYARRAHAISSELGNPLTHAGTTQTLGTSLLRVGLFEEADRVILDALAQARRHALVRVEIPALRDRADSLIQQARHREAYVALVGVIRSSDLVANARNHRLMLKMLVACCRAMGRKDEETQYLDSFDRLDRREQALRASAQAHLGEHRFDIETAQATLRRVSEADMTQQTALDMARWMAADFAA